MSYMEDIVRNIETFKERKRGIVRDLNSYRIDEIEKRYKNPDEYKENAKEKRELEYKGRKKETEKILKTKGRINHAKQKRTWDQEETDVDLNKLDKFNNYLLGIVVDLNNPCSSFEKKMNESVSNKKEEIRYFTESSTKRIEKCEEMLDKSISDLGDICKLFEQDKENQAFEKLDVYLKDEEVYIAEFEKHTKEIGNLYKSKLGEAEKTSSKWDELSKNMEERMENIKKTKLNPVKKEIRKEKNKYFLVHYFNPVYKLARWANNKRKNS